MNKRLVTTLKLPEGPQKGRHFIGLPPELTGGNDNREMLPWPSILIIEENEEGVFLYRFTESGICGGDTWHLSIEDAQHQADLEYGNQIVGWKEVPDTIDDALSYGLKL